MKAAVVEASAARQVAASALAPGRNRALSDFVELVKARLTLLVLLTTAVGFYLGEPAAINFAALFHVVFGTALAAAAAAALNQWWERAHDALMERTKARPIPAGRMAARDAFLVGICLGVSGVAYLGIACNWLSAALAAATIAIYIFCYTPLKRVSTINTLVGAIPGALPPLIGWAAAAGGLSLPAWSLFAILFCWQMPHFFAIAWMYRDDYARAGFRMLSHDDQDGRRSATQCVLFALLVTAASALPVALGLTSAAQLGVGLVAGAAFIGLALAFYLRRDVISARRLFVGSIIYLPVVLAALVLTKR